MLDSGALNLCLCLLSLLMESMHNVSSGHSTSRHRPYNKVVDTYDVIENILFISVVDLSGVAHKGLMA